MCTNKSIARTETEIIYTSNFCSFSISFFFRAKCRAFSWVRLFNLVILYLFSKFLSFKKILYCLWLQPVAEIWEITILRFFFYLKECTRRALKTHELCSALFILGSLHTCKTALRSDFVFIVVVKESSMCSNKDVLFSCFIITISTVYDLLEDFSLQKSFNNW